MWRQAATAFDKAKADGLPITASTYTCAINAMSKGGRCVFVCVLVGLERVVCIELQEAVHFPASFGQLHLFRTSHNWCNPLLYVELHAVHRAPGAYTYELSTSGSVLEECGVHVHTAPRSRTC